jgi:hypothetical protein
MAGHELADRTSLALHRAVADRLREDPSLVARARARVVASLADRQLHAYYGERWLSLLDGPLDLLLDELTSSSEAAQALRQTSPFAGVLDPATPMKSGTRSARARCLREPELRSPHHPVPRSVSRSGCGSPFLRAGLRARGARRDDHARSTGRK